MHSLSLMPHPQAIFGTGPMALHPADPPVSQTQQEHTNCLIPFPSLDHELLTDRLRVCHLGVFST